MLGYKKLNPESANFRGFGLGTLSEFKMPLVKLYRNGLTMGSSPVKNDHVRAKRGVVEGWSKSASRNNKNFLYSVDTSSLTGVGYAFTFTLRLCPNTSDDWRYIRNCLFRSLSENIRLRFIRLHWVTEWQRRGVPHLHGIVFYDDLTQSEINHRIEWLKKVWVGLTDWTYQTKLSAQHVSVITDVSGWFKYLSKHAARGADHYQRSNDNIPVGWKKTGRVWGYKGDWVTDKPLKIELCKRGFFSFRRVVRAWRKSDARAEKNLKLRKKRIVSARKMLSCNDIKLSSVRGVSEWISQPMAELILWNLVSLGFDVSQRLE